MLSANTLLGANACIASSYVLQKYAHTLGGGSRVFCRWQWVLGMLLPARCAQPGPFGLQPTNVMVMTTREVRAWISCVVHGRERSAETLAFVREAWGRV